MAESHEAFRAAFLEAMQALRELKALKPRHRMAAYNQWRTGEDDIVWHCPQCGHTYATLRELMTTPCNNAAP